MTKEDYYSDIIQLVQTFAGKNIALTPETRIVQDLKLVGDDVFFLIEEYAKKFNVDISGFLWYFHAPDESTICNPFSLVLRSPDKTVPHIPITIDMLCEFAVLKKWNVIYPEHKTPVRRSDLWPIWVLIACVLFFCLYYLIPISSP